MSSELEPCRDIYVFPAKEVLKYVKSLEDTCIMEVKKGTAYTSITEYAEAHFEEAGSFTISSRHRADENADAIGNMYKRVYRNRHVYARSVLGADAGKGKEESKAPELVTSLGLGVFSHKFVGTTIYLCHFLRDVAVSSNCGPEVYRSAILFAEGRLSQTKSLLQDFAKSCLVWYHNKTYNKEIEDNKFRLFRFKMQWPGKGSWVYEGQKRARKEETVFLRSSMRHDILSDCENFLDEKTREWYKLHGISRRRSYLFYGTPGSGKTSMIRVLAGKYKLNACFLSLAHKDINNQVIADAMSTIPPEPLLVLEDVDTLFHQDHKAKEGIEVTFSGVLNMLDGLISGEDRLTVMTTNHIERLDSAMIRCGRVDRLFHMTTPDRQQITEYFKSFYPDAASETCTRFVDKVVGLDRPEKKSMATLQQFFIFTRQDCAETAVNRIGEFFERFFEDRLPNAPNLYM